MTRSLRVVIADDELLARKRLSRLLEALPQVELVAAFEDARGVLEHLDEHAVDVLFLDINMPGLTGMEAAALLPEPAPHVIFCTAYADHAVEAFERGAVDYLMKPVEAARLKKAIDRAHARMAPPPKEPERSDEGFLRLAVPTRKGIVLLDPLEVSHATIDGELVTLVVGEDRYITDYTLNDLESRLGEDRFERVHRRAFINLDAVACLEPLDTGGYAARMKNGDVVTVSRSSARRLRRRFQI